MDAQEYIWGDLEQSKQNRERVKNKENTEGYPSVWDINMKKLKCPYLKSVGNYCPSQDEFFADYRCDLTDKRCTLEYEGECREWEEIKAE